MKLACSSAAALIAVTLIGCSGSSSTMNQPSPVSSACAFAISPSATSFTSSGGSQTVRVSATPAGCAPSSWTASTTNAALSVSPTSGSGNGSVTVTASANAATTPQALTATIAGQMFAATVAAVACTYKFSANAPDQNDNTWAVPWDGRERGVTVIVTPNDGSCAPWKTSSNASWLTASPASGTTSTTVRIDDSANDSASARTGTVSFLRPECSGADCGLTVALNQSGRPSFTLRVTLMQGEQISGPYQGIVTGPNDFSCSLSGAPVSCPPATFPAGSTVPLAVALVHDCCDDRPIFTANTKGCDSFAGPSTCIVNMTGNRDVTIGIGCAICLPLGEVGDLLVGRWRAQIGRRTPLEFRVADHPF